MTEILFARKDEVSNVFPGGSNGQVQINSGGLWAGITNTQLTALIEPFTDALSGAVPASGGGTTKFLRADGTWVTISAGGLNNVVEDLTPQLGGNLDVNGFTIKGDTIILEDMLGNDYLTMDNVSGYVVIPTGWFSVETRDGNSSFGTFVYDGTGGIDIMGLVHSTFNNDGYSEAFYQIYGRGTAASPTAVQLNDILGFHVWRGYTTATDNPTAAQIRGTVDSATMSATSLPGRLEFYTTPVGGTSPLERMRIDSQGQVGIGDYPTGMLIDGSPSQLQITTNTITPWPFTMVYGRNDAGAPALISYKSRSSTPWTTHTAVQTDDNIFTLFGSADDGTNQIVNTAILFQVDGAVGANSVPSRISFSTSSTGAGNYGYTERLRVDNVGRVGIGAIPTAATGFIVIKPNTIPTGTSQLGIDSYDSGSGGTNSNVFLYIDNYNNDGYGDGLYLGYGRGTRTSPVIVNSGDTLGLINFSAVYDTGQGPYTSSTIAGYADGGTYSTTSHPGGLIFSTTPDGTLNPIQRFWISGVGHVGINTVPNIAGWTAVNWRVLSIKGANKGGVVELISQEPDAADNFIGFIDFNTISNTAPNTEVAQFGAQTEGTTANNRGGRLVFFTKEDGTANVLERMRITSAGHVQPGANDGGQLGVSGTAWSDLFLASGGVINFNAGDVTITHSANTLTITGGITALDNLSTVNSLPLNLTDAGFDVLIGWDDSAGQIKNLALADIGTEAAPAAGDYVLIYGAEGDLRKVNWSGLPGAGGGINNVVEDLTPQLGGDLDVNNFAIVNDNNNNTIGFYPFGGNRANLVMVAYATATGGNHSAAYLDIESYNSDGVGSDFYIGYARGTAASKLVVQSGDTLGTIHFFGWDGVDGNIMAAEIWGAVDGTPGDNDMPGRLSFGTTVDGGASPTEWMRLLSNGRLIHSTLTTTFPSTTVATGGIESHVTAATTNAFVAGGWGNTADGPWLVFTKSRNTVVGSHTTVQDGDEIGRISFWADDGTNWIFDAALIKVNVEGTPGLADMPTAMSFWTTPDGSDTSVQRLQIDNTGVITFGDPAGLVSTVYMARYDTGGGGNNTTRYMVFNNVNNDGVSDGIYFAYARGDNGTKSIVQSGDFIGGIIYQGYDGAANHEIARIDAVVDGTPGSGDTPGRLVFGTTPDGSSASVARMVIDSAGVVRPNADDGAPLGKSGTAWSDLFLASGAVINFNAGNYTVTHSAGILTTNGALVLTSTSASAFSVGRQGSTNPVLNVNANTASVVTGLNITGAAAAGRLALAVTSSGTDEGLSIDAKGAGTIRLGATSTGAIEFSRNAVPTANDGSALGTTSLSWADLFLASGAVINFNAGNYTITHSAGLLTTNGNLSLTTSGVLTTGTIELGAASDTTISRSAAGVIAVEGVPLYSNIPQNSQSAAYTTVLADAQKHIFHPSSDATARTFTIDSNANVAYPIGTTITFVNQNGAGVVTIAITSDTMRLAGAGTTGSRTLAANGIATAIKVATTEWLISGTGLT